MLYSGASFDILTEPWNSYELHDKTVLRTKTVLTNLLVKTNEEEKKIDTTSSFELVWNADTMPRVSEDNPIIPVDKNMQYSEEDIEETYELPKIDSTVERKPSVYYINGGYYLLAMHDLTYIARTKYCNQVHQPIFIVKGNPKSELIEAKKVY